MSSASPPTTFTFDDIQQSSSRISTPLAILFEKLDAIPSSTIPSGFIRNTKLLNSLYAKKQQQIDVIIGEFASLYTIPINFLALFEQRMMAASNTLTRTQTMHYCNVLDFYLQFKITNNVNRVAAKSLLSYLESHPHDPDNSLIGLTPSKSILENLHNSNSNEEKTEPSNLVPSPKLDGPFSSLFTSQDLIEMILMWDEMNDDDAAICIHQFAASARNHGQPFSTSPLSVSSSAIPSSPLPISASMHSLSRTPSSPSIMRSASYSSLNNLSTASPPGSPSSPSRQASFSLFPTLFKKSLDFKIAVEKTPWKEGDVVVVFVGLVEDPNNKEGLALSIKAARDELNENAFMFARVSDPCIDAEHNVGVYIDKNETKARVVSKESVFVVKFDHAVQTMVSDASQLFFSRLSQKLAEKTNLFLVSQGLDLQVLEKMLSNDASFFDLPVLKHNIACVHSLQYLDSITWTKFLDTVRTYCESKVKAFVADIETEGKIFALSRKQVLAQLHTFDYTSIPSARLRSYLTASQNAIDSLKKHEDEILDGTAKQTMSTWYLDHIKECVDEFLVRNGFSLDVIPENYIDQAPQDLALVGKNWAMIRELLDVIITYNGKDSVRHEVIDVMTSLMDDIYTRLEEFVRDSLYVISARLGEPKKVFDVADNQDVYDELCKVFESKKASLDADLKDKLEELIKDVEYIFKIREMEGLQQDGKCRDHVPISGLIASRFFRLENELRTSLDVWDPERAENIISCAEEQKTDSPNFENATLKVAAVQ